MYHLLIIVNHMVIIGSVVLIPLVLKSLKGKILRFCQNFIHSLTFTNYAIEILY